MRNSHIIRAKILRYHGGIGTTGILGTGFEMLLVGGGIYAVAAGITIAYKLDEPFAYRFRLVEHTVHLKSIQGQHALFALRTFLQDDLVVGIFFAAEQGIDTHGLAFVQGRETEHAVGFLRHGSVDPEVVPVAACIGIVYLEQPTIKSDAQVGS